MYYMTGGKAGSPLRGPGSVIILYNNTLKWIHICIGCKVYTAARPEGWVALFLDSMSVAGCVHTVIPPPPRARVDLLILKKATRALNGPALPFCVQMVKSILIAIPDIYIIST